MLFAQIVAVDTREKKFLLHLSFVFNTGLDKQKNRREIVNIFLPIYLAYVLGAQKNRLIETVLLSTHNICFD